MKKAPWLPIFLLFLAMRPLHGQVPGGNRIGMEQGLTQLYARHHFVDSHGLLWIGTTDGLFHFDGKKTRAFPCSPADPAALAGGNIQSDFFEDDQQDLWLTSWEALYRYDRKHDRFVRFQMKDAHGEAILGYELLWREPDNRLWVIVNQSSLYLFDPKSGLFDKKITFSGRSSLSKAIGNPDGTLHYAITKDKNVATFFERTADNGFRQSRVKFPSTVFDIEAENDSIAWACGRNFFKKINIRRGAVCPSHHAPPKSVFIFISPMPDGAHLLVGTDSGVRYFNKKAEKFCPRPPADCLPHGNFSGRAIDGGEKADGDWVVFVDGEGAYFGNARKRKFSQILPGIRARAIAEDRNGQVWVAEQGNRLFQYSPQNELIAVHSTAAAQADPFLAMQNRFMFFDRENRGWFGGELGLQVKLPDRHRFRACQKGIEFFIHGIELQDGRLLFSQLGKGIVQAKKSARAACGFTFERVAEISAKHDYTTLFQSKNGLLYVCRELTGIAVFSPAEHFREVGFLKIAGEVNHFYEDPGGETLWISTSNGLVRHSIKDGGIQVFDQKDGLQNPYVLAAIPDGAGNLWLSTHGGIVRFSPEKKGQFRQFLQPDGVEGLDCTDYSFIRRPDGEIWFGSSNGISVFNPEKMLDLAPAKRPYITGILVNNQLDSAIACPETGATNPSEMRAISLDRHQNTLSFQFSQPEFGDPARARFLYKMVGMDDGWFSCGPGELVHYRNLPPGNYGLLVRGFNSDGVESALMAQLSIEVRPAFWQTGWFRLAVLAALVAIGHALYRRRIARLRQDFALRQSVLENEKKALENSISRLLAQMNPHFVFNGLNSINNFVLNNEGLVASEYLAEFAALMRNVLDYSSWPTIQLAEETGFLEKYLALESRRMDGRLDWQITVDGAIDDEETEIPPMLIQPLVENAIWHGIPQKDGPEKGLIRIHFKKENGGLTCTVEDNGGGLKKLAQKGGHASKSQSITHERLALFDRQHGTVSNCTVAETAGPDGLVAGARAVLMLGHR